LDAILDTILDAILDAMVWETLICDILVLWYFGFRTFCPIAG
jgi:hypothetical protein